MMTSELTRTLDKLRQALDPSQDFKMFLLESRSSLDLILSPEQTLLKHLFF
jgi:hypothetical protein